MKVIKYLIESIIIYIFFIIIKLCGLKLSRLIFSKIFIMLGPFLKSKDVINNNLYKIDKQLSEGKKREIIYSMWSSYGKTFVEYLFLKKFRSSDSYSLFTKIKGQNYLDEIKIKNKPVIFVSGHFSNFELMSMHITKQKINLAVIYRPLNNIFLNTFIKKIRKKHVCRNQIKKGLHGIRHIINSLKNKTSIALMIDQRLTEGEKLPFFNHNASTTTLPAQLALRFKCKIVPIYIKRDKNNNFEIEIYKPIDTFKIENTAQNKIQISLELNKIIEKMILKDPSQWILTHNRWK